MRDSIIDREKNLQFNRDRWGRLENWTEKDQFGYRWGGGVQQTVGGIARFSDRFLQPYMNDRYDHDILELSPGGGRFTAELIRFARNIDLIDMNEACLEICKERFKYYPIDIAFFLNDGTSCDVLGDRRYSFVACFDSMVHMHPSVIEGYVKQLATRLNPGGIMWLDHSGKGIRDLGHRTDMTPSLMATFGESSGLHVVNQTFRNDHDCVTVFSRAV